MNKKILDELSAFLKKNNIMICSSRGEVSLLYDAHGPDREMFSTGRNSISSYDAELLSEECGSGESEDPTAKARDLLVMIMPVYFSEYIRNELAGDFAASLAEKINGLTRRAEGVATMQPPLKESVWEDFQAGCPSMFSIGVKSCTLRIVEDTDEYYFCEEDECPLIYLKKFTENKS